MRFKLIACNVFAREAALCAGRCPNIVDYEFTELGEHADSDRLRKKLQGLIDATEADARSYDAILLLFGLCGNATLNLKTTKTRLVIPRAHDCATILLGSKQEFRRHFEANPSTPFSSVGYLERGEYYMRTSDSGEAELMVGDAYAAYVTQYGEENARYIWDMMHPKRDHLPDGNRALFIDLPETSHLGYAERFRQKVEADGRQFVRLEGSIRLIQVLLDGNWDPADFLIVEPGQSIAGVYDWDEIIRAK